MRGKRLAASEGATFRKMPGAPSPIIFCSRILPFLLGHPTHLPSSDLFPAPFSWQAHMEAVHADWKEYLNLLICEESHLKYMEDYHQVPSQPQRITDGNPSGPPPGASRGCRPKPPHARAFDSIHGCAPDLARPLSVFLGGQGWRI